MHLLKNIGLRSISINTFFQFLVRISTTIPTFLATILIAYYAGFEALGSFTKIVAFVSIFYLLVDFGMNSLFLKNHMEDAEENLGNLLLLRSVTAIILLPIVAFVANLLPYDSITKIGFSDFEKLGIVIYSFTLVTFGLTLSLQAYIQKKLSYSLSFLPSIISSGLLIVLIVFSAATQNLPLLLLSYVISGGLMFVSLFLTIKKKYSLKIKSSNFQSFSRKLIISSLPLGIMLMLNLLYSKADTLILSFFRSTSEVGVYGVSYRIFELTIAVPAFMANSVYPILLSKQHEKDKYHDLFKKYLFLFFAASVLLIVLVFLASPLLSVLRSGFKDSILPLRILSISLPFFFMTSLLQWYFLIKGRLEFLIPVYGFSFLINILLNIILIPKFSYVAAAATTGFSEGLVFLVLMWYFLKDKR